MNEVCHDPAYNSPEYRALSPILAPRLTSDSNLYSDVDENVKCHKVDVFAAEYLLVRTLLHRLVR